MTLPCKSKTLTDVDVLVAHRNKVLVIQAKSKRLTMLSRIGNEDHLARDFKLAVQDAYEQGITSRNAILHQEISLEGSDKKEIQLDESVDEVYLICLTSDPYPAVALQTRIFLSKSTADPFPVTISLFDLDTLSFYLKDPFEFMYYIRQRSLYGSKILVDNEMGILAFHLTKRLQIPADFDIVHIENDYAQLIDAYFPYESGNRIHDGSRVIPRFKWKSLEFDRLIKQIKGKSDPKIADIVFFLFDLPDEFSTHLMAKISDTISRVKNDKQTHAFSIRCPDGNSGISFVCGNSNSSVLKKRALMFSRSEKYSHQCTSWLGLGKLCSSRNETDIVIFDSRPWVADDELERLTEVVSRSTRRLDRNMKIGRNDPCHCGSGAKYKKCCGKVT